MIEISIYIILAAIFGMVVRIYKSKKSGLFYNTRRLSKSINIHPKLKKYYNNIHFISSPANYYQQLIFFILIFCICRLKMDSLTSLNLIYSIISSWLIAWGQSTLASYKWQIWINRGVGLPDIDENENNKSEFAWGRLKFWFSTPKIFNGKNSIFLYIIGSLQIIIGLIGISLLN